MKNQVELELYIDESLIESKNIDIYKWYDGDIIEIDSEEYRRQNNITLIKGTQYGDNGEIEETWATYYDNLGRLKKSERYDESFNLIDVEEIRYDKSGKIIR